MVMQRPAHVNEQRKVMMSESGCMHRKVTTYVFVDGNQPAGLWACADCGHKFAPVNLIVEKDAERYRWLRHGDNDERCIRLTSEGQPYMLRAELLDRCIDEAIADDADAAAHTVAVPAVGAA